MNKNKTNEKSNSKNRSEMTVFCCQMAEVALSEELLCSDGGRSASYFIHLAQLQLLKADYCSAAANLKEALSSIDQVLPHYLWLQHEYRLGEEYYMSVQLHEGHYLSRKHLVLCL